MAGSFNGLLAVLGGALLVCAFAVAGIMYLQGGLNAYNVPYNTTTYQAFNQSQQIINITEQTQEKFVQYNTTGTSTLDIITLVTTGGYNTLQVIGETPAIYSSFIQGTMAILGIPATFGQLAFYYVIAIIIVIFILLVFRVYIG